MNNKGGSFLMKRLIPLCLALVMALTCLVAVPAQGADLATVQGTVQALGIMTGDENGNMNLTASINRAEFAKMLVMASPYKDSVASGASNYSLFSDVRRGHWATEYIRVAVEQGWVTGYSDGTFRPDQTIKLEEAAASLLRLLGYENSDLVGSYPAAQINKFHALGLGDGITVTQGQLLTRGDCMYIFYNLMTAETKSGSVYATTLGYSLTASGELDYAGLVSSDLKGPFTAASGRLDLPFTPVSYTKNGHTASASDVSEYDIYYYNENTRAVYLYSNRITGTYTAATPSTTSPTSVTVAGNSYTLGTSSAAYKMSSMGDFTVGDVVTLLIGMDGTVADVVAAEEVSSICYGVVTANGNESYVTAGGAIESGRTVEIFCTDGTTRTFTANATMRVGSIVSVSYSGGRTVVRSIGSKSTSGQVSRDGTKFGDLKFASDVQILDTDRDGNYAIIYPSRLAGYRLDSDDVRWYATNEDGEITYLILNNATGDIYTYGLLTNVTEVNTGTSITSSYSYVINGTAGVHAPSGTMYNVESGGARFIYSGGQIDGIRNLNRLSVDDITTTQLTADDQTYKISEQVQVYLRSGGSYNLTNLAAVGDTAAYDLVAYYDDLNVSAGGLVRVIVATPK